MTDFPAVTGNPEHVPDGLSYALSSLSIAASAAAVNESSFSQCIKRKPSNIDQCSIGVEQI